MFTCFSILSGHVPFTCRLRYMLHVTHREQLCSESCVKLLMVVVDCLREIRLGN